MTTPLSSILKPREDCEVIFTGYSGERYCQISGAPRGEGVEERGPVRLLARDLRQDGQGTFEAVHLRERGGPPPSSIDISNFFVNLYSTFLQLPENLLAFFGSFLKFGR